jgi:hypothetical protein
MAARVKHRHTHTLTPTHSHPQSPPVQGEYKLGRSPSMHESNARKAVHLCKRLPALLP